MAAEPGKPEEQPVDDVWKAAAYGNMDKTKEFIEADPQLVNKPDATGYVLPYDPDPRERSPIAPPMHPTIIFFRFIPNRQSSPPSPDPNTPAYTHLSTAGTPGPPPRLTSRTHTHPRTQVPAPAVGGAQQQSRGCNLPHRTGRGGERH